MIAAPCGSNIEPTSYAWKALNKTLKTVDLAAFISPNDGLNWKLDGTKSSCRLARRWARIYNVSFLRWDTSQQPSHPSGSQQSPQGGFRLE